MSQIENSLPSEIKNKKYKWLFFLAIAVLIVVVIFFFINRLDFERNFGQQSKEMIDKLNKLKSENSKLTTDLYGKKRFLIFTCLMNLYSEI
jgi:uncharacterized protein YpmS